MKIFASFIISFVCSLIFVVAYRNKAVSPSWVIMFFLVLFLSGLAAQYWLMPVGPTIYGVSWVPLLAVILVVTLLFASPSPGHNNPPAFTMREPVALFPVMSRLFMWILLLVLLVAIILGIMQEPSSRYEAVKMLKP